MGAFWEQTVRFVLIIAADVCLCGCFHVLRWREHTMAFGCSGTLLAMLGLLWPLLSSLLVPDMPFQTFPTVHSIIVHAQG